MLKPDCRCSSDYALTREIRILGTPVRVKNYLCAKNGGPYKPKPEKIRLQLSILISKACNAHCPFCIAAPTDDPTQLDPGTLREVLEQLKEEQVLRGITITGGEPCLDMDMLDRILRMIFDIFGREMEVTLDSNGTALSRLRDLQNLYWIDAIHISRHHWDDSVNDRIFGRAMPTAGELRRVIRELECPDLFVLNCLLLHGVVDSPETVHRYLDFAVDTGAGKVSFITADPVNPWTAAHRVNFDDVLRDGDESLLFTREYRDFRWCRCRDGVYVSSEGKLIEFYGRQTEAGGCDYCRGLVYGPDNLLRAGFSGPVLNSGMKFLQKGDFL